jgi:hypothetical protein
MLVNLKMVGASALATGLPTNNLPERNLEVFERRPRGEASEKPRNVDFESRKPRVGCCEEFEQSFGKTLNRIKYVLGT